VLSDAYGELIFSGSYQPVWHLSGAFRSQPFVIIFFFLDKDRDDVLFQLRDHFIFPEVWRQSHAERAFSDLQTLILSMISKIPSARPTAENVVSTIRSIRDESPISWSDGKHHLDGSVLLGVVAKPSENVLGRTMELVKEAASPDDIKIVDNNLRGGGTILLRVEAKPSENVLGRTMELVKEAASPDDFKINDPRARDQDDTKSAKKRLWKKRPNSF
jgi:hypothetical protein